MMRTKRNESDKTYRVRLDNPAANSRTHVEVSAPGRRAARRKASRDYPRHVIQRVQELDDDQEAAR